MNKDNDYSIFFVIIGIWLMVGALAQCETSVRLDDIRQELGGIRHELNLMGYK